MRKYIKKLFVLLLSVCIIISFSVSCSSKQENTHWLGAWNASATNFTFLVL